MPTIRRFFASLVRRIKGECHSERVKPVRGRKVLALFKRNKEKH
jgi:hypothetical protein